MVDLNIDIVFIFVDLGLSKELKTLEIHEKNF
jgi:hypothetical protein